jgi:hypothetical protein
MRSARPMRYSIYRQLILNNNINVAIDVEQIAIHVPGVNPTNTLSQAQYHPPIPTNNNTVNYQANTTRHAMFSAAWRTPCSVKFSIIGQSSSY